MKTSKSTYEPFFKKTFGMPSSGACCGAFLAAMEQFETCCGMAEMMGKAGCDCGASEDQSEGGSGTAEKSDTI